MNFCLELKKKEKKRESLQMLLKKKAISLMNIYSRAITEYKRYN